MANAKGTPRFPVFVIGRSVDAGFDGRISELPISTPLMTLAIPAEGKLQSFLPWFTSRKLAQKFIAASNQGKGVALEVKSPKEAADLLEQRNLPGICLNPVLGNELPRLYQTASLVQRLREMAAESSSGSATE